MLKSVINFLFCLLVFVLIIDPGDLIFRLKVPLFASIFLIWFLLKKFAVLKINKDILFISFIFLIIPVWGVIVAIIQDTFSDQVFALGFIKSFFIITSLVIVVDLKIPVEVYLNRLCIIIPIIIIPTYILLTINPSSFITISNYLDVKDVAKFSNRNFYGYEVVMLYYRTSPLLVFPLAYYCSRFFYQNKKFINIVLVILFLFTLILSGTRANMLSGAFIVIYFLFDFLVKKRNKLPFLITCVIMIFVMVSFLKTLSFSDTESSSEVKAGHMASYMMLFEQHPQYLIWGAGLGSTFYTSGLSAFTSQTELTYIDLVRWFGIPITLILFFLLLYPIIFMYSNNKIHKNNKYLIIAYIGYLFIAGTNPLLVSSTGMLAVITMYSLLDKQSIGSSKQVYPALHS
jgi:hypothetical protein